MVEDRALWRPWAWYCPLLAIAGWLCSAPAVLAMLADLNAVFHGHEGPGVPAWTLVLAAVGLVLDVAATLWSVRQVVAVVRRRAQLDARGVALAVVLAVTVVAGFYQWQIVQITHEYFGPHYDAGAAPPLPQ